MTAAASRRATLEDVTRLLVEGHAVELIDGEIVPHEMTRAGHGRAQLKFGALLDPFNRRPGGPGGPGGWWLISEVEVLYAKTEEVFRHDAVGFRRDLHPEPPADWPVKARPDWACEILSPSTARYDLVKKHRTLHAHGVPYYWIADPDHETLTVYRHHPEGYLAVVTGGVGDVIRAEPFEAVELDVAALFGREN